MQRHRLVEPAKVWVVKRIGCPLAQQQQHYLICTRVNRGYGVGTLFSQIGNHPGRQLFWGSITKALGMSGRRKNWSSQGLYLQWPLKAACSASAQSSLNELYTKQYKFCPSSHDKEQQSTSHPHMYRLARKLNRNVIGNSHSVN